MPRRVFLMAAALGSLALALGGWTAWWRAQRTIDHLRFGERRVAFLEDETRRLHRALAEKELADDAADTGRRRREIEQAVERLRGLNFLRPVTYREIPRSELPAILRAKLGQQMPDQEFDHAGAAWSALGLIPAGLDLKRTYLSLLGEQVGAFYDQHTRELFTFSGQSLASAPNQVILAHELTHALEDQRFGLLRLPLEARGNDDRVLAASALVEGDATLVMNRYMAGALTAAAVRESLAAAMTTDVRHLAAAPRFLRESLLFPYLRGQEFCQALFDQGGWAALARAFERPPASTAMILHPERYLADPAAAPTVVDFPPASVLGEPPLEDNVLGEFGVRQWLLARGFESSVATDIGSGWQGDRYLVYGGARAGCYVWQTDWRSAREARAFGAAASRALGGDGSDSAAQRWRQPARSLSLRIDAPGRRVLLIQAVDAHWLEALTALFGQAFDSGVTAAPPAP